VGDQAGAIAFLRRVQQTHPGDYRINLALGHASFGAAVGRSLDDAIRHYTAAIAVRPEAGVAWYFLGRSLFLKGRVDESIAVYRRLVAVDPRYPLAHSKLATLLSMKGQPDEAIAVARASPPTLAAASADAELLAGLLNDRARQLAEHPDPRARNPDRAVALAGEAVALQPAAGAYWETLGLARYRAGDWRGAADALATWAQLGPPGNGVGAFVLAIVHGRLGRKEVARKWYDQAVAWMDKNQPKNEELRRIRAEATELLGIEKKKD
jgi:tetratricopeptide (TPR) repeat protein